MYSQLLLDLFMFLAPFLRNAEFSRSLALVYKASAIAVCSQNLFLTIFTRIIVLFVSLQGTLRVLLLLLHDFPEFLGEYHFAFCDVIPPSCIQMRNLVLSAFPRKMRLPDPFAPSLQLEVLPDIQSAPRIMTHYQNNIQPAQFKKVPYTFHAR